MSEIWIAAVVGVAGSAIAGAGAQEREEAGQRHDAAMSRDSARWNAALSQFEAEQADYYSQLNRKRKQRGLENFRQFSQVSTFAPQYAQQSGGVNVGQKPNSENAIPESSAGKASGGGGLPSIMDPLGLF